MGRKAAAAALSSNARRTSRGADDGCLSPGPAATERVSLLISSTVREGRTRRARIGGHRKPIKPSTPTPPPPHPRILLLYASFIYCVHLLIPVEPVEARSVPDVCRRAPPLALFLEPLSTPRTSLSLSASHSTKQTKEQRGMEKQAGGGILPGAGPPRDVTLSMVKNWMEAHPLYLFLSSSCQEKIYILLDGNLLFLLVPLSCSCWKIKPTKGYNGGVVERSCCYG